MKKIIIFLTVIIASSLLYAQTRITGGDTINITEAPWQVLLTYNDSLRCGGVIVAPNFILTARHCLRHPYDSYGSYVPVNSLKVIAGITCRNEINSSNTFDVVQFIPYPGTADVALVRLSNNITYNNDRQPINYWASADNTLYNIGNSVRVSGWGWTIPDSNSLADCLQAVNLNIISNQDVPNELDVYDHEMVATGSGNIRLGGCNHDSGGPLTTLTATNEPVLIGTVRGGVCRGDNQSSPSIFVRVSHIRDWVHSVICATNYANQTISTDYTNQLVNTYTTVNSCGTVNVNNTTVTPNGTLNIRAINAVNIGDGFTVQPGGGLNINVGP